MMTRQYFYRLMGLFVLLLTMTTLSIAQSDLALTTTILNARSGPGTGHEIVTQFPHAETVALIARNDGGDWLYVRSVNSGVEGWVTATYLSIADSFNVMGLPVQMIQAPQAVSADQPANNGITGNSGSGKTISVLNVRTGPGTEYEVIGQIADRVEVIIEDRNRIGNWIIVRTLDGAQRGWVATRYVNFAEGLTLEALLVSNEIVGASPEVQELADFNPDFALPDSSPNELAYKLSVTPISHNFSTPQVWSTLRLGRTYGNRPNVFMKVGDSVTDSQPFLLAYGQGGAYNLGDYGYLQDTINFFAGVSPRDGVANSFTNRSFAAITGATTNSMLDGLWADPNFCSGDSPLMCEINLTRPSVGLVLFGTQDMSVLSPAAFRLHLSQIVEAMTFNGVIPVLSTFHNTAAYYEDNALLFNNIIVDVSNDYGVPLINLWRATQPLPDNGVNLGDPVHLSQGNNNYYNFTGEQNLYGVNMRNLLSLQALDMLRKDVLTR